MTEDLKHRIVTAYLAAFDAWLDAVDGLDDADWATPTGCPGWDVRDQLSHVIGVERLMLGDRADELELPDLPHVTNPFSAHTEVAVHARRGTPPAAVLAEAREVFDRRSADLAALDPAALQEPMEGPAGMRLKGSMLLRTRIFDITSHEYDVRRALDRPREPGAPHDAVAVEQVLRSWARNLPQRGVGPGRLVVEVAGVLTATLELAEGGFTVGELEGAGGRLRCTVSQLLALGGGRSDAPSLEHLGVDGATTLVAGAVAAASITP